MYIQRKVTVIGNGVLSLSVAAQVAVKGDETFYIDLSRKDAIDDDNYTINVVGVEKYSALLKKLQMILILSAKRVLLL